jgi:hypothetical protein
MSSAFTMSILGLVVICALGWMLMAWPLIVRRFFSDRQFADLLAGDQAHLHRRAPDAGLTSLGWLLLSYSMLGASFLLPRLVAGGFDLLRGDTGSLMMFGVTFGVRSLWFSVGTLVLGAWAGYELVRMSPQSRIIATVYGVVAAVVTLYVNWPIIQAMKHIGGFIGQGDALVIGPLAFSLILPIATVILVNRKIAPTARARFRTKPAPTPPGA